VAGEALALDTEKSSIGQALEVKQLENLSPGCRSPLKMDGRAQLSALQLGVLRSLGRAATL
jgi:hypothetical protein